MIDKISGWLQVAVDCIKSPDGVPADGKMADDLRSRMMGDQAKTNSVLKTMVFFSLAMLFLPVFLYFFSKSVFFESFLGMSSQDSYFYAAFVAIGTVHVILGMFVYIAFTEGTSSTTSYKAD